MVLKWKQKVVCSLQLVGGVVEFKYKLCAFKKINYNIYNPKTINSVK